MKRNTGFYICNFAFIGLIFILTNSCVKADKMPDGSLIGSVKDIDGNVYHTIEIGTQTWMTENLKTTKYSDGSIIPVVTDNEIWNSLLTGASCDYDNIKDNNKKYGRLYNWFAVNDPRKIAPVGWHVPTDSDWAVLENFLIAKQINVDSTSFENRYAKTLASATGWERSIYPGAVGYELNKNNLTQFSALPAGNRYYGGTFDFVGILGIWWSSTERETGSAWHRSLHYNDGELKRSYTYVLQEGASVRCIKD